MKFIPTVGIFAAFFMTSFAHAAPSHQDGMTREVSFNGIDLSDPQGQAMLNGRIAQAARNICGRPTTRDLREAQAQRTCYRAAIASAAPQVELAVAKARDGRRYAGEPVVVAAATPAPKGM